MTRKRKFPASLRQCKKTGAGPDEAGISRRKSESVEIVPLSRQEINARAQLELRSVIAQMVDEGVKKAMSGNGAELQPFFGSKEVSYEIKRRQTVHEQNKFSYYFEDWGCMICGSAHARYLACGMCATCYARVKQRLVDGVCKRQPQVRFDPSFIDPLILAREALAAPLGAKPPARAKTKRNR